MATTKMMPDATIALNDLETQPNGEMESHTSSDNSDIEYHYLSFDTPVPTQPVLPAGHKTEFPPCPNLLDYENPFNWSLTRKRWMTYLACSVNITAAYAAGSYAAPADELTQTWGVSHVFYNFGITIFCIGFGTAPMVLAPFSEINGRRPMFITSGILFVACQLACALVNSFGGMLAARLFLGIGGSTFSTMVGGILADVWITADRNTAMVLFTGATIFGTGLGPLVSGYVAQNSSWRWVFYIQLIISGVLVALVTIFFKETRGSIIISRKAKALNMWYQAIEDAGALGVEWDENQTVVGREKRQLKCKRIRWKVKADEDRASIGRMIAVSVYRPIHMLFTESVVFWFSCWISFSWAVLYLWFGSVPLVYRNVYGFTLAESGAVFASMCVAGFVSTVLSIWQENWAVKHYPEKISGSPEGRLYFTCVESALMPIGLFWFGWTCYPHIHWIVPTIGIGIATMGIFSIYLAVFNYSADVYQLYASSALAASNVCRNLLGGAFPLLTVAMFENLGYHTASSVLGGIGIFLSFVPWVLVMFGPKIRARSKIASQFV